MDSNWKMVYESSDRFEARVIEAKLKENNIECVFFNHQDSVYMQFNTADLTAGVYVHQDDEAKSLELIAAHK